MLLVRSRALTHRRPPWPLAHSGPRLLLATTAAGSVPTGPTRDPIPSTTPGSSSSTASERTSAYLWLDSVYPIRRVRWDPRPWLARLHRRDTLARVQHALPAALLAPAAPETPPGLTLDDVLPHPKDGGALLRISFPAAAATADPSTTDSSTAAADSTDSILAQLAHRTTAALEPLGSLRRPSWLPLPLPLPLPERPARVFPVRGHPWLEDLDRFPARELRVDLEGPVLPIEQLYTLFRPYGHIRDLLPGATPQQVRVLYSSVRAAAAARTCLHAASIRPTTPDQPPTTRLRIVYADQPRRTGSSFKDFATSHPRITLPLLVALLGTLSYVVFDPIRQRSVQAKVERTWDAGRWHWVRWIRQRDPLGRLADHLRLGSSSATDGEGKEGGPQTTGIERERQQAKDLLRTWLLDNPDTFVVVTGPQGSGKTALVNEVLADGKNVLTIDCQPLLKHARSEAKLVSELASAVGYRPQFALAGGVAQLIDLASVGLIGQKAGFASTLDAQLKAILEVTAGALARVAQATRQRAAQQLAQARDRRDHAAHTDAIRHQLETVGVRDGRMDVVAGNGLLAELGGGIEGPSAVEHAPLEQGEPVEIVGPRSRAVVQHAAAVVASTATTAVENGTGAGGVGAAAPTVAVERLPVVVIKGFAAKGETKQVEILWDVLSEWAALLIENQIAHVVVVTAEAATLAKPLARALPSKPFNVITLNDASPAAALQYVAAKLAAAAAVTGASAAEEAAEQTLPAEAHPAVLRLGGRQTDLDLLVQKTRAGQTVQEAVDDLVQRNASELRKNLFGDDEAEAAQLPWTRAQAWALVQGLGEHGELKYHETLLTTFGGDDAPLRALEAAGLVTVHHHRPGDSSSSTGPSGSGGPSSTGTGGGGASGRPSTLRPGKPVYRAACALLARDAPFRAALEYRTVTAGIASAQTDLERAQRGLVELSALFNGEPSGRWAFGGGAVVPPEIEARVGELLGTMRAAQEKREQLNAEKKRLLEVLRQAE